MESVNDKSTTNGDVVAIANVKVGPAAVEIVNDQTTLRDMIKTKISAPGREDPDEPFFVVDLGEILLQHQKWKSLLPRVKPFYAVKSNDDPAMILMLNKLGTGFDCASKGEIKLALECGVDPSKIVYANPYKQQSHIKFAQQQNVSLTVFNDEGELYKMKELHHEAKLLLRIWPDHALKFPHNKFGAQAEKAGHLLEVARELSLEVVGVSFHTGWHPRSNPTNIYETAVKLAKDVFDLAPEYGYNLNILDVGGGFHAVPSRGMTFEEGIMYHIAEGTFQTFDHALRFRNIPPWNVPNVFEPLEPNPITSIHPSVVWGRSCAAYDWIEKYPLPEMENSDWVIVKEKGDYTSCVTTDFNGFTKAILYHFIMESHWETFKQEAG